LGWRIHRIWSTDWFRNPEKELERVAASIEEARASGLAPIPRNVKTPERHLERDEVKTDEAFENRSAEYTMHEHSEVRAWWGSPELHEFDSAKLGDYFRRIVKTEAPVHEEEASRRILHANGVTRLGTRIRKAMQRGIRYACGQGWIEKRGKFLYIPDQTEYTVRNRLALPNASRKIEFIAPEEIQIAIQEVIENSWGIRREDIPLEVCRMFGFAQTSEQMRVSIDQQVERLFEKGVIRLKGDILVMNEIVK
jgi:hypothetical protein